MPGKSSTNSPVIIIANGFTTTIKRMTDDKYAERIREAGYAVLLYDHRNLGNSDGTPGGAQFNKTKDFYFKLNYTEATIREFWKKGEDKVIFWKKL
jgi:alpha-beta hydrolase superfamily lysophospholipase